MKAELRVEFPSAAEAAVAMQAIEPDNAGYVAACLDGAALVLVADGPSGTVLRSLDDALGCLRALGMA